MEVNMPVDKLVIKRSLWGQFSLLNDDGTMCCLGHLSKACGIKDDLLLNESFPSKHWTDVNEWARCSYRCRTVLRAATINDGPLFKTPEGEAQLIKLFVINGVELSFED
jgi:hypothetical protein